jgi:hypothetical protein
MRAASRNCPCASDLASRRASDNTLAANAWGAGGLCPPRTIAGGFGNPLRVPESKWSSAPDLHRHEARLQLAAYLFRSSGANRMNERKRRRRGSNARDCRRPRFSKPACYHSSTSP